MVILALILLAVFGLSSRPESSPPTVDLTETSLPTLPATVVATVDPTETLPPVQEAGAKPNQSVAHPQRMHLWLLLNRQRRRSLLRRL